MALVDTYRNNVIRKNNERAKLIENRGKERSKIVTQNKKILSAKSAISRTKSPSTIKSRKSEIERAEKEINNIYKRIDDFDKKITQKEKEIIAEKGKLQKEEQRIAKKQADLDAKRLKEGERQMKELLNKPTNQYINNGGQMNIANDNATIYATYNHSEEQSTLDSLVNQIKDADLSVLNEEEQEILIDNVDVIQEQLSSDEPKKGFIKTAIAGLSIMLYKSAELTEPLQKLIEFAKSYIG